MTQPTPEQYASAILVKWLTVLAAQRFLVDVALGFDEEECARIGRLLSTYLHPAAQVSAGLEDDPAFAVEFDHALLAFAERVVNDLGAEWGLHVIYG